MINATMNIRMVPLHEIRPYENNVKQHPVKQLESIVQSIKTFGFRQPLVLDRNNTIVCGHARYEAAATIGLEILPCEIADELTEEQINAYRILDNEIAKQGTTDFVALTIEMAKLPDFDFKPFNLDIPKIEQLKEGLCDADEVPAITVNENTKAGDVWLLGDHRLMCGDATMIDQVEKLLDGNDIEMVFTDPPYGIDEQTDRAFASRTRKCAGNSFDKIIGDESTQTAIDAYNLCHSIKIPVMVFWGANYYCHSLPESANWLVWDKRQDDKQRDMNSDCELAWVRSKAKSVRIFRHLWKGMIKASENGEARCHPTQKPVALAEWAFNEYAKECQTILDLFGGSGSTLIACEKTNRKCFMMEISRTYCDVIIKRWQKFTGKDAILESTNQTYSEVANG